MSILNSTFGDGRSPIFPENFTLPCEIPYKDIALWFLIPILIMLILLVLLKYKEFFLNKILGYKGKIGYIKIFFILDNKRLLEKLIKLDKYNNFHIRKRKYSLEKMQDFIIGYDKYNFPIFMYDKNFILPLTITKTKINRAIKEQLKITDTKEINAISMKLDSSILYTVYDKKLISDLYSISGSDEFKQKIIWIIIIIVGIIILWYTGILGMILSYLGIDISNTVAK